MRNSGSGKRSAVRRATGSAFLLVMLAGITGQGAAQTTSPVPASQPAVAAPVQQPASIPEVVTSAPTAPAVPVTPRAGTVASSSVGKFFGTVGRGLPGMSGGPPVNGMPGVRDPSSQYMRPPVIPPLLCDPAVDLPC